MRFSVGVISGVLYGLVKFWLAFILGSRGNHIDILLRCCCVVVRQSHSTNANLHAFLLQLVVSRLCPLGGCSVRLSLSFLIRSRMWAFHIGFHMSVSFIEIQRLKAVTINPSIIFLFFR